MEKPGPRRALPLTGPADNCRDVKIAYAPDGNRIYATFLYKTNYKDLFLRYPEMKHNPGRIHELYFNILIPIMAADFPTYSELQHR
ncbi:MAG: hypothetical protein HWD60_15515 [Defluviicoccus sp.]|nr:MAG: hypothetical protein HWD60_15515 [Defluviicoccus sp.]